jgi:hypothetical protein
MMAEPLQASSPDTARREQTARRIAAELGIVVPAVSGE